jgi:predicted nuclease of predicted toxin-antitoxin system
MKFFLDENFPKAVVVLLSNRGHEAIDIRGTEKEGATDVEIFRMAQEQGAVFLTTDRDFFHTIPHSGINHHGIVVVALRQPNRQAILRRIEWFLSRFCGDDLRDKVFELRDQTYVMIVDSSIEPKN